MKFEVIQEGQLGAAPGDVAQEAVDAAAATYANDQGIDVAEHLRIQLASRGLRAVRDEQVEEISARLRSGHPVDLGRHDGSVDSMGG